MLFWLAVEQPESISIKDKGILEEIIIQNLFGEISDFRFWVESEYVKVPCFQCFIFYSRGLFVSVQPLILWWIKRDLRCADNAALSSACLWSRERGWPVVALWIDEPEGKAAPDHHPRRDRFVYESLQEIQTQLEGLNIPLWVAQNSALGTFAELIKFGVCAVFSHEETGTLWTFKRDLAVKKVLQAAGVNWFESPTNGVVRRLKSRDQWQTLYQRRMSEGVLPIPEKMENEMSGRSWVNEIVGSSIFTWNSQRRLEWEKEFVVWQNTQQRGGEKVARALMERFLQPEIHGRYISSLSKPKDAQVFGSRLSPYLAFGCLSSKQVLNWVRVEQERRTLNSRSMSAFKSRLAWRCHFVQKHENFPEMEDFEQNAALAGLRPAMNAEEMERWRSGETGYPLIDACLRSVHTTGFLNFRMRALLMSFATHLLWRDWRFPAWDLAQAFLDYEPGIHFSQVQMQACVTGNNQIRIYNPLKQSLENDPDAAFIKKWVPELKDARTSEIHGLVDLPTGYPKPMFELNSATQFARDRLFKKFAESDVRNEAKAVQAKLGSRGGFKSWRAQSRARGKAAKQKKNVPKEQVFSEQTLFDTDSE